MLDLKEEITLRKTTNSIDNLRNEIIKQLKNNYKSLRWLLSQYRVRNRKGHFNQLLELEVDIASVRRNIDELLDEYFELIGD